MIVIGHRYFGGDSLYRVNRVEDVNQTPSNSTVILTFSEENLKLIKHLSINSINMAIEIKSITEAVISENYRASFLIVPNSLAKELQEIADNYLFDSKILTVIESDGEIEKFAKIGIDGVLLKGGICSV